MMQEKFYKIFLIVTLFYSCNSPEAPDCFKSAGEEQQEERILGAFDQIEIHDRFEIILVEDSIMKVKLEGPKNTLSKINTRSENGKLYLSNDNTCNFVRSFKHVVKIHIHSPWIKEIQNYGTGNISNLDTLHYPYMKVENRHAAGVVDLTFEGDSLFAYTQTGVADFVLRGNVIKSELFNQGLGSINASALSAQESYINNNSINDISAFSNNYLFAINYSKGNIFVYGTPLQTDIYRNGSGVIVVY